MTGWLRNYVLGYAKVVEPLQVRKTYLNRQQCKSMEGLSAPQCKIRAARPKLKESSENELEAFQYIQNCFAKALIIHHFNKHRTLWIDLDGSKEMGIGAVVYHTIDDAEPNSANMEPIYFLSRLITDPETRYWPTEL